MRFIYSKFNEVQKPHNEFSKSKSLNEQLDQLTTGIDKVLSLFFQLRMEMINQH